eukprot:scaffold278_cov194-Alexandrium_tamarense.AAC.27
MREDRTCNTSRPHLIHCIMNNTDQTRIDGHKKGTGMRAQVPWGKHNPPTEHRLKHVSKVGGENGG